MLNGLTSGNQIMKKMMIVDDSSIIRRKISRCYESCEFNIVATARNGLEALAQYVRFKPDIITMDLTMPQMDGIETIEKLMAFNPNLKILVVSALNDKATGIEALKKGAQGFLCKPFNDAELTQALNELMAD